MSSVHFDKNTGVIIRTCTACKGSGVLPGPDPDGDYDDWDDRCVFCNGCGVLIDCVDDMCLEEDMDGWCIP